MYKWREKNPKTFALNRNIARCTLDSSAKRKWDGGGVGRGGGVGGGGGRKEEEKKKFPVHESRKTPKK